MRLVAALATSLALHAGTLALPEGTFSTSRKAGASESRLAATERRPPAIVVSIRNIPVGRAQPYLPGGATTRAQDEPGVQPSSTAPVSKAFGIPSPRYYDPVELSRRARAVDDTFLLSPELERAPGSGRLILVLRIASNGQVDAVEVAHSTLDEPMAAALAERFRKLRFHPAEINGAAVNSRMKIEVLLAPPDV